MMAQLRVLSLGASCPWGLLAQWSPLFPFFFFQYFYLFIFGCAGSSLLHRFFFSCDAQASHCGGFSCCGVQALGHTRFSS